MMEDAKDTKPAKSLSLKISEAVLEGTLFLLFGSKKWHSGKRPLPPVYIVGGIIILLIFIMVIKKVTAKPKTFYPPGGYQYERFQPRPQRLPQIPGGSPF